MYRPRASGWRNPSWGSPARLLFSNHGIGQRVTPISAVDSGAGDAVDHAVKSGAPLFEFTVQDMRKPIMITFEPEIFLNNGQMKTLDPAVIISLADDQRDLFTALVAKNLAMLDSETEWTDSR